MYEEELTLIQTWIYATSKTPSCKLQTAKPKMARPLILWEVPSRVLAKQLNSYTYTQNVTQYGRLFVDNASEGLRIQSDLISDMMERKSYLANTDGGVLKDIKIEFKDADGLDIPFTIKYEVTYCTTKPVVNPINKITTKTVIK